MWLRRACSWTVIVLVSPLALADEDYIPSGALQEAGLMKHWQLRLPLVRKQTLADLYLVDDQLYAATADGWVYAIHAATGAHRWLRQITDGGYRLRRPCHVGDRVVFAVPTTLLQLDRVYGEGKSRLELKFPAGAGPITDGARVFLGGLDQRMYAFLAADPLRAWRVIANGPVISTPVLYESNLFFASSEGAVYSCVAANKAFRWQTNLYGSVTGDLAVNEHGVYVPSRDQSLYLLDFLFGQVAWQARFSGPLYEAPVVTSELAYQFCPDDGLVAVNTTHIGVDERIRWKLPRGRSLLTVDERHAYVLSQDDSILVAAIADGKVVTTLPAPDLTLAAPSPGRMAIFLAAPDGRLICVRPRGTPPVTQEAVMEALNPPGAAEEAAPVTTRPKPAPPEEQDLLRTSRTGVPIGGKSKVSKEFGKGGGEGGSK